MSKAKDLIKSFKAGHTEIVSSIDQIQVRIRSFQKAKMMLSKLDSVLSAHLKLQNNKFYDDMTAYYSEDRESLKMLEFLVLDVKDLRVNVLTFFDKYVLENSQLAERTFPKEFMEFSRAVLARLEIEEQYLFPLIDGVEEA